MAALLVFMLILLTFAAIFIAVTMARNDAIEKDTLWYEIGKLVAQAGILTGFGALVTLLVHEFQQDQEESRQRLAEASQRLANRHEWLRDFAASLTDAYGQLKQARRRLQWDVTTIEEEKFIATNSYEKQLRRLSVIQTEFESLLALAETYFAEEDSTKAIEVNLRYIVDRLSALISERKKKQPRLPEEESLVSLQERDSMRGFTAESEEKADFEGLNGFEAIRVHYKQILRNIVDELRLSQAGPSRASRARGLRSTSTDNHRT
jgi:hypothetical protein